MCVLRNGFLFCAGSDSRLYQFAAMVSLVFPPVFFFVVFHPKTIQGDEVNDAMSHSDSSTHPVLVPRAEGNLKNLVLRTCLPSLAPLTCSMLADVTTQVRISCFFGCLVCFADLWGTKGTGRAAAVGGSGIGQRGGAETRSGGARAGLAAAAGRPRTRLDAPARSGRHHARPLLCQRHPLSRRLSAGFSSWTSFCLFSCVLFVFLHRARCRSCRRRTRSWWRAARRCWWRSWASARPCRPPRTCCATCAPTAAASPSGTRLPSSAFSTPPLPEDRQEDCPSKRDFFVCDKKENTGAGGLVFQRGGVFRVGCGCWCAAGTGAPRCRSCRN